MRNWWSQDLNPSSQQSRSETVSLPEPSSWSEDRSRGWPILGGVSDSKSSWPETQEGVSPVGVGRRAEAAWAAQQQPAGWVLLFPTTASRWELKPWSFSFSRWVSGPHTQWCHPPLPRTCSIALAGLSGKVLAKGRTGIQAEEQGRAGHLPGGQPGTAHSPGLGGDWGPELGIGPKPQQALKRPQDTRPRAVGWSA